MTAARVHARDDAHRPRHARGGRARRPRARLGVAALAPLLGLLGSGMLVWHGTDAAFTATTGNASNGWGSATVVLTDNDGGSAMFPLSADLVPGATATRCIDVTYAGTAASTVRLYASSLTDSGSLAPWITLVVDAGTGTSTGLGDCSGFVSGGAPNQWTGSLSTLPTTWDTGVLSWTTPATTHKLYKVTYTLSASTPDAQQGKVVNATLTWEARTA